MNYSLNKQLEGEITRGQQVVIRQLLGTEEGMDNFLRYMSKHEASMVIEKCKGAR